MSETFDKKGQVELVRSSLKRIRPQNTSGHPDANLLAAFAENTLPQAERATVLAHLADCAGCREYLAFATSAPSIQTPESQRRFSPIWRWATPAAALAALCMLLIVYQREFTTPHVPSKTNPPLPTSAPQLAVKREPPQQVQFARNEQPKPARKAPRIRTAAIPPPPAVAPPTVPPPEVPVDALTAGTVSQTAALPAAPTPPLPQTQANAEMYSSSKSFASPPARSAIRAPAAAFAARRLEKSHAPSALWNINAGLIQRSTDNGKTWQAVPVSEATVFRALASEGSEIWAGGSNGALFHSSDGGSRWQPVSVAADNAHLSGTIVSINAQNLPRIEITTDSGEQWISEDGGREWRRGTFRIR